MKFELINMVNTSTVTLEFRKGICTMTGDDADLNIAGRMVWAILHTLSGAVQRYETEKESVFAGLLQDVYDEMDKVNGRSYIYREKTERMMELPEGTDSSIVISEYIRTIRELCDELGTDGDQYSRRLSSFIKVKFDRRYLQVAFRRTFSAEFGEEVQSPHADMNVPGRIVIMDDEEPVLEMNFMKNSVEIYSIDMGRLISLFCSRKVVMMDSFTPLQFLFSQEGGTPDGLTDHDTALSMMLHSGAETAVTSNPILSLILWDKQTERVCSKLCELLPGQLLIKDGDISRGVSRSPLLYVSSGMHPASNLNCFERLIVMFRRLIGNGEVMNEAVMIIDGGFLAQAAYSTDAEVCEERERIISDLMEMMVEDLGMTFILI